MPETEEEKKAREAKERADAENIEKEKARKAAETPQTHNVHGRSADVTKEMVESFTKQQAEFNELKEHLKWQPKAAKITPLAATAANPNPNNKCAGGVLCAGEYCLFPHEPVNAA